MSQKSVKYLLPAEDINMGGIIVKQALPTQRVPYVDPFLLLHHGTFPTRSDAAAIHQGIGPHPHRGFSPVTFVINGEIHHRDSRGNSQIAKAGEVQWMHAGAGIVHSERPSDELVEIGENQEIIQLWINSPAKSKMNPPVYQHMGTHDLPRVPSIDKGLTTKIIAGEHGGIQSLTKTESDLLILWSRADDEGSTQFEVPQGYNSMFYVVSGSVMINGYGVVGAKNLVIFEHDGDCINLDYFKDADIILLSGMPINEKIVQHGPFVMNSQTEIMEAMRDYQMGKMGILIEE